MAAQAAQYRRLAATANYVGRDRRGVQILVFRSLPAKEGSSEPMPERSTKRPLKPAAFAASTAFLGPIGYQTNLFVYGPGGYKFTDYFRVGAPLQILLSTVTVLGIAAFWGL